jgi:signal transduction histidine kinase/CheY-like chemotaxis protein
MVAPDGTALRLLNGLADRDSRGEVAAQLAAHFGALAFFVLVRDHTLGVLRPAAGFPQTLPGGPTWKRLLTLCGELGEHRGDVAYPDRQSLAPALAHVGADGTAFVWVGGSPRLTRGNFDVLPFPLLGAMLRAESAEMAAAGFAEQAQDAMRRSTLLARALDSARAETERKAAELQVALAEAERLNTALHVLNNTLEQRVAARTRQLEEANEERRKMQAALLQAQKMEAIGQLTGGVAHDFNNLLQVVIGNLDALRRRAGDGGPLQDNQRLIENGLRGAQRGAALVERLLAFSRQQPLQPKTLDANRLVAGMSDLLRRTLGESIVIETVLAERLWLLSADPNQLESALLNLAVNARDAMPDGGKLVIETANTSFDSDSAAPQDLTPGQYVMIAVYDSGEGMTEKVLTRAFDPFFTTKGIGQGTGLGLSQVYGFVRQSGGHVQIHSELRRGTAIKIYLPRVHDAAAEPDAPPEPQTAPSAARNETLLVVEDDDDVRTYTVEMLRQLGYSVIAANDGPSGLHALAQNPAVRLLFTDVGLPGGMNGRQLADEARRQRPQLRVLFTTGYARDALDQDGRLEPGLQLIAKPFTYVALAAKIRQILGREA